MSILKQIIDGHLNEFKSIIGATTDNQEKIFKSRENICLNCPLKKGNTCDPKLSINPITFETALTSERKAGFKSGCGCRLSAKQKSLSSSCPAGFWGKEQLN